MSLQSWPGLLRLQDWEWTVSLFGHWRLGLMDIPWASSCVHCVHVSLSWGMQLPDSPIKGGVKYSITGMPLWPSGWFFFWSTDVHGLWPWCCGEVAGRRARYGDEQANAKAAPPSKRTQLLYPFIATFLPWRHVWKQSNDTWILWERLTLSSMCRAEQTEILPIS